ncbi:hypothetical protein IGJ83_003441 [Enterococcus pernyi]
MSVEETTAHLEISDQEETIEEVPVEETGSSYDNLSKNTQEQQINEEKSVQDYVTEMGLKYWNINDFPLIISRGDQLIRPELIPNTYYYVNANNSSLPAGYSWMRASDRLPLRETWQSTIKYMLPDIVQDTTGSNLDLFFDVSQSANMRITTAPGRMWTDGLGGGSSGSFTANISLENSNGLAVEKPIYFYHGNVGFTMRIKKDDLIGVTVPSGTTKLSVVESEDYYTINASGSMSNATGWIIRNGAQVQATATTAGQGISMFLSRPSDSAVKNLAFESFPIEGGSAESNKTSVFQSETVDISASPNPGYQFSRWEIASGSGGLIEDVKLENTNFTMGSSDTVLRAIFEEIKYEVVLEANPTNGGTPEVETHQLSPGEKTVIHANPHQGYDFVRWEIISGEGSLIDDPFNAVTDLTIGSEDTMIKAVYETKVVSPVDPLDPEVEVSPENTPELPEDQGQLSIDFISSFNFGSQAISVNDQTYYAKLQRLLNEDGTVNEFEERPNYIQISDRRPEKERNGWELAVTQKEQFKSEGNQVLNGASLVLSNQQVITAQGGTAPSLQSDTRDLIPGQRRTLLKAQGNEGAGTWIYRWGDGETAGESVALKVPKGANPEVTTYKTTLIWELAAVPDN